MKGLLLALLFGTLNMANAQNAFEKESILLDVHMGIGSNHNTSNYSSGVMFSGLFGIHKYLSVGPYYGISFLSTNSSAHDIGGKLQFHWWQLLDHKVRKDLKREQFDIYSYVHVGYDIVQFQNPEAGVNQGSLDLGAALGMRWYPKGNNRFALNVELGNTPASYASLGASLKFR